ncbi:MAG: beta-lactamase family protein [Chitinophagaceae bacterium]|nr:beta-lactamase family protein [Chitinophagaceae bacterium]
MRKFCLMLLTLCYTTIGVAQRTAIDAAFDSAVQQGFSGVLLVAKKGKPLVERATGYRHFETQTPLQFSDVFELASVSKQFTAMAIMMLQEEGRLQYDDSLSRYIELPYTGITIRQLLNHTSGLPDYQAVMDAHWDKTKVAGNDDCIRLLRQYQPPMLFTPGAQYRYSNTGYLLLASVVEKVSGEDFISFLRQRIFAPLKMKHTDIRTLEAKAATLNFAAGHLKDATGTYINANKFHSSDYTVWLGNRKGPGRISSTAADLLRWDKALYKNKLVQRSTLQQAFSAAKLNNGELSMYGFGWDLETHSVLGNIVKHNGDNPGYSTQIIRCIDKRYTVIVLCNNVHPSFRKLLSNIMQALAAEKTQ